MSYVDAVARRLVRRGLRAGLLEGNRTWLAVAAIAAVVRLLWRAEAPEVLREDLRVGETIIVHHRPAPPTKRQARRLASRAR